MTLQEWIGIAGIACFFLLLIARIPVAFAMILAGIFGYFFLSLAVSHIRFLPFIKQFKTLLWHTVAHYDLSVVPLFLLMGYLAARIGISRDLFSGINAVIGRFRGGTAMATVGTCAGFGAVCGSSLATAATMGKVALPELLRLGYAPALAAGTLAAGGTLGILIPPSVVLVIYAVTVEASVLTMFQAAVVPGLLAVALFLTVLFFWVRITPHVAPQSITVLTPQEKTYAVRRLIPIAVIFSVMIGGLGLGFFTPTPAAGIGVFVVCCYGLYTKQLSGLALRESLLDTATTTAMIYTILFGAEVLKAFFSRSGLPMLFAEWATGSTIDPWFILIGLLVLLIILGMCMESLSMILVVVPFFWPVLVLLNGGDWVTADSAAYGMTTEQLKIWFGILALIVVELGLITPPVGLNVFIIKSFASNIDMRTIFRGIMPFFSVEILRIGILLFFPAMTLFIPQLL